MRKLQPGDTYLIVGPTEYCKGGSVSFGNCSHGEIHIEILEDDGGVFVATIPLQELYGEHPGERCVWLKAYEENEGLPEALARAGVLKLTGRTLALPYGDVVHAELTDLAYAHYTRAINSVH